MRYVIYGAGAIGGTIGGRLHQAGREVVLIARGAHLAALRGDGLRLRSPDSDVTLRVGVARDPGEADLRPDDVVILAMKTQDSPAALDALARACPREVPVVCAQNGVENERLALRRFPNVYGMLVWVAADHLVPGQVEDYFSPSYGILDLGRYPRGTDEVAGSIAADLSEAGFVSRASADIMPWKYQKLLGNLANAAEAATGSRSEVQDLLDRARGEALACFDAAGISYTPDAEMVQRSRLLPRARAIGDRGRAGGSSWQSLARRSGAIEADYLNGEVILLGRQHGVATPVNDMLQRVANRLARDRMAPGSLSRRDLEADLSAAS
jgi:2-dehydropantoate 2-reductase